MSPLPLSMRPGNPPAARQVDPVGTVKGVPAPRALKDSGVTQPSTSHCGAKLPRSRRVIASRSR
jgi:hypothetical protein